MKDLKSETDRWWRQSQSDNTIEDTIPAEFYNQSDAKQAIGLTGQVILLIRPLLDDLLNDEQ